jgi:hypothetical protein
MMFERVDFNKRAYVRQPNFTRWRLGLRSPIPSVPSNLEDQQISYDIYKLVNELRVMGEQFESDNTILEVEMQDIIESLNSMNLRLNTLEEN